MTPSDMAKAKATAHVRPWKIGLVIDASDKSAVKGAIADLSSVWGGVFMPILDSNLGADEIITRASDHGVDALYSEIEDKSTQALIRKPGWTWNGRGPAGPFGEDSKYLTSGLLSVQDIQSGGKNLYHPEWPDGTPNDLVYSAVFGLRHRLDAHFANSAAGPERVGLKALQSGRRYTPNDVLCLLQAGEEGIWIDPAAGLSHRLEIFVLERDDPGGVVRFWNRRAMGFPAIAIPVDADSTYVEFLELYLARHIEVPDDQSSKLTIGVHGAGHANEATVGHIKALARRLESDIEELAPEGHKLPIIGTEYERSSRLTFRPDELRVDVDLPSLPIKKSGQYFGGVVAAEVSFHGIRNLDPRLTLTPPPVRSISPLAEAGYFREDYKHARISEDGWVLGVDALDEAVAVPNVFVLDVIKTLLGDKDARVKQSDIGKFQSRAAEKLGGPFSGFLNQPGIRAALEDAAQSATALPLKRIHGRIKENRGDWPFTLGHRRESEKQYADRATKDLMATGIFVPVQSIHCTYCRVDTRLPAEALSNQITCEFCGQSYNLALSHALKNPKWSYRLAGHLQEDQVRSLLPVLAATSLLRQFRHVEGSSMMHVLGLEVQSEDLHVETDFAIYLQSNDYTLIIGEAKNRGDIDENDLRNLRNLQKRFWDRGVRTVVSLVTLKDQLSDREQQTIRSWVEETWVGTSNRGSHLPVLPLILTKDDLSHHPDSEDHPWRWETERYEGIMGKAIASCERNLGLVEYKSQVHEGRRIPLLTWS